MSCSSARQAFGLGACLALLSAPVWPQTGRSGGMEFFRLPTGAGPAALGEAVTAAPAGLGSILYNPASIARLKGPSVGFSFLDSPDLLESRYAAVGAPVGDRIAVAAFAQFIAFDAIALADENGVSLGDYAPHASIFGVAVSRGFGTTLDLGLSAKWMSVELAPPGIIQGLGSGSDARAAGWGVDVGATARWSAGSPVSFGAALLDLGPGMHLGTDADELPTRLRLGVAVDVTGLMAPTRRLPLSASLAVDRVAEFSADATAGTLHAGLELLVLDLVALRSGMASTQSGGDRPRRVVGLGLLHPRARLEFAYELSGSPALENQTHASVAIRF